MPEATLTARLRGRAAELGADHTGIAPASADPSAGGAAAYQNWVAKGMHGKMGYMARRPEDRPYITRWFPAARSVLLAAFSYHEKAPRAPQDPARGRLARYSLCPDYHDEIKRRMKQLLAFYRQCVPGGRGKVFVDTSPVLERLYGRYAGIGWVGKNTMLLSRKLGSYFILAGMAVDRELEYNDPVPDHCGTCTRCLEACPTDAFPQERVLDATRCIAYTTIEANKSPISAPLRPGHGDWIFGCDVCQEVCPWNKFSIAPKVLKPVRAGTEDLLALAKLTPEEFKEKFRGTPLYRTGLNALLRNVLLAMGNSGDTRYRAALQGFLSHEDPMVAEQASWSLQRLS